MGQKQQKMSLSNKQRKQATLRPAFNPNIWFAVLSAVVGFLLYVNTVKHDYVLDDLGNVTGNPFVAEGFRGIPKILSAGMWHFENLNLGYYRPLSLITFAVENQFFPQKPHVSHLGNVFLYALTGFFLCFLLMEVFRHFHPVFALITTLLFMAHPVHTEVVANIKSRDEILAFLNLTIAILLLLFAYRKPKTRYWLVLVGCVFFYLGLLSKETAMTGLVLLPLFLFFSCKATIKQALIRTIPFALMLLIFQFHKFEALGTISGQLPNDMVNYPYREAGSRLPSTFVIFLHCLRLVIFPHPLTYDYSYNQIPAAGLGSPLALCGFLIALGLSYFSIEGLLNGSTLAFGVSVFGVTLAPALGFVFLRGGILAERFLYAPCVGFGIAVVWLLVKLGRLDLHLSELKMVSAGRALRLVLPVGAIFVLYSIETIARNPAWRDNMALFSSDVDASPNSCQVRRHYGSELVNMAMAESDPRKKDRLCEEGLKQLRIALKIYPHFGEPLFKMGVAYQTVKGDNDTAIFYYARAIQEIPGYAISYNNLGVLFEGLGKQELASYYYNKAVDLNPYFADGVRNRDNLKRAYGLDVRILPGAMDVASLADGALQNEPDHKFYYKLGTAYGAIGDYANATHSLERAVALNPAFVDALANLANCYGRSKEQNKAVGVLNKIVALCPTNAQALGSVAVTYELLGNTEKAAEYRDRVRKLTGQ
jgi:protein O-mannosyl-transferase